MERVDYESVMVQDILTWHDRSELDITPWYQRRSVWTTPQKGYLINTIHERKPVPALYIRYRIDLEAERSIKELVDGQQRIRCVLEYKNGDFKARHPSHKGPVAFADLTRNERINFLQAALSVGYLVGASDADVIEIFARINSVAKTLNPQERRNAQFGGEFKQFCLSEAVERLPFWRDNGIFTDNDIARMVEVQFVSDLVMNLCEGLQDFSASRLTAYYDEFDAGFDREDEVKLRLDRIFSHLVSLRVGLLKTTVFSRPGVLFSLMLVIDQVATSQGVRRSDVERCIVDVDSRVEAVRSGDNVGALSASAYEAFTGGNMHRIKSRRIRDAFIRTYWS